MELALEATEFAARSFDVLRPWPQAVLARLYLLQGNLVQAERENANSHERLLMLGRLLSPVYVGLSDIEIGLARKDPAQALAAADALLDFFKQLLFRPAIPEVLYLKGEAFLMQGDVERAIQVLTDAHTQAEALGSRRMLWRILFALSEIERQRGNAEEARSFRALARELVEYIAAHTPDSSAALGTSLRESFLKQPTVKSVLSAEG
jgi:tetratricopeptide (TPR) repeat protein